jgi:hypothetical protein
LIPKYDIFRIDGNEITWIEPAITLDDAKTRIQRHGAKEPGDYFIYDQTTRNKLRMSIAEV